MTLLLEGKTALVTGASKGVGKGIALELARQGCAVAVNYHSDADGATRTVAEIEEMGWQAVAIRADVGERPDVEALFARTVEVLGVPDIAVCNSGTQVFKPFLELSDDDWDRVIRTNLRGSFLCAQVAGRLLKGRGRGGRIVLIGSGSNKIAFPQLASYTASKGGIEMLTKVAAAELGPYGITVNCVAPGAIEIERTRHEAGGAYGEAWGRLTPLGRVGTPQDVGHAVALLCTDAAGFITGQTVMVDGGLFAKATFPYEGKN